MIGDDQLSSLVGVWEGEEQLAGTAWAPAGTARGRLSIAPGPGGGLLVDYVEERDGLAMTGHGVLLDARWWWFDSLGFLPDAPGRAEWRAGQLVLERRSSRGRNVTSMAVREGWLEQQVDIAMSSTGPLAPFLRGRYARQCGW